MTFIFSRYWSAKHLLDHTLGDMGFALEANEYFQVMPMLRDLSERFIWRMSDCVKLPLIMDDGPVLVNVCLDRAMNWMARGPVEGKMTRRLAHTYFAAGLFYSQADIPFIHVDVDGKEWSFADGENLGKCIQRGQRVTSKMRQEDAVGDVGGASVRMVTLTKLFPNGGHLLLDLDLTQVLWPRLDLMPAEDVEIGAN